LKNIHQAVLEIWRVQKCGQIDKKWTDQLSGW
jgi:hypothetical protein